jgi:glycosyltransferase involved in cell wall biosynthesis
MRICFISHTPRLGGAERVLLETITVLRHMNMECYVLLPAEGELSREVANLGVPYDIIRNSSWVTWERPTFWARSKAIVKIALGILSTLSRIRRSGCDLVYSNTLTICNGGISAALLRIPHVWHLHDFPGYHGVRFYYGQRFSFRVIDRLSSICITVSKHLSALCAPYIRPEKLKMIYPPMMMAMTLTDTSGNAGHALAKRYSFRCVIVGGLVPSKGQEDAVRALGCLRQEGLDVELLVVGAGDHDYRARLEHVAASCQVLDKVRFLGLVTDAMPYVKDSDVALVCSTQETFGRVTIEAMVAGVPVIGARAAATIELIQHGENGLLYEPGNPDDLAAQIKILCDNPGLAHRLAQCGRSRTARFFTETRYANEIMAVLTHLPSTSRAMPTAAERITHRGPWPEVSGVGGSSRLTKH